ncbi:phage shock protein C (PspC) family protein [Acinetobacter calcoaceticus]|uniref:Phage shock protein C (PspC) family protein n=1 Tax=Acinetobacter calcoaceticus TaxID=471 RepID=A0A4R1Y0Y8_ACICA|nr:phage shock protein C (PspC) family protein [Acinetobacter calcoaceticus]
MQNPGLYRSSQNKMIAGVMGGIAQRFGWNATLLRLIFVAVSLLSAGFPGILVYLVLWFVIPKQSKRLNPPNRQGALRTVYDEQRYNR